MNQMKSTDSNFPVSILPIIIMGSLQDNTWKVSLTDKISILGNIWRRKQKNIPLYSAWNTPYTTMYVAMMIIFMLNYMFKPDYESPTH